MADVRLEFLANWLRIERDQIIMLTRKDVADEWRRRRVRFFVRVAGGRLQTDRHCTDDVLFRKYSCIRYGSSASRLEGTAVLVANLRDRYVKDTRPARTARCQLGAFTPCSRPDGNPHRISRGRSCR
jgi:hypothetical protein